MPKDNVSMNKYQLAIIDLDLESPHDRLKDIELLNKVARAIDVLDQYIRKADQSTVWLLEEIKREIEK